MSIFQGVLIHQNSCLHTLLAVTEINSFVVHNEILLFYLAFLCYVQIIQRNKNDHEIS